MIGQTGESPAALDVRMFAKISQRGYCNALHCGRERAARAEAHRPTCDERSPNRVRTDMTRRSTWAEEVRRRIGRRLGMQVSRFQACTGGSTVVPTPSRDGVSISSSDGTQMGRREGEVYAYSYGLIGSQARQMHRRAQHDPRLGLALGELRPTGQVSAGSHECAEPWCRRVSWTRVYAAKRWTCPAQWCLQRVPPLERCTHPVV